MYNVCDVLLHRHYLKNGVNIRDFVLHIPKRVNIIEVAYTIPKWVNIRDVVLYMYVYKVKIRDTCTVQYLINDVLGVHMSAHGVP